jgi:hypothetical protein
MRATLYRVAERDGYFGPGSYWTPSVSFASRFAVWAKSQSVAPELKRAGLMLWSLDLDEPDEHVLDLCPPRGVFLHDRDAIDRCIPKWRTLGLRWVFFQSRDHEGGINVEAVYIGDNPLSPTLV